MEIQEHDDPAPAAEFIDLQPLCTWQADESHRTIHLHLQGFRKEEMRVRLETNIGMLTITGQRTTTDSETQHCQNKPCRFRKEIKVSKSAFQSPNQIRAKFSGGVLSVLNANPRDTDNHVTSSANGFAIILDNAPSLCSTAVSGYFLRFPVGFQNLSGSAKVCLVLIAAALLIGLIAALSLSFWSSHRA